MRAAAVQVGPAIADPAPAQMAVDGAPGHGAAQHLDGGAQVVLRALAGENHGRHAPCLGHPAHRRVALRRDPGGRKPMTAWQLTLDHEHRVLFGTVVEHLLRHYPGGEVAQRLRHHALARLLAPGNHAVPGDEVGARLDGSFEAGARASALDDTQVRPPDLTIEVAHPGAGLLQTANGPLVGRGRGMTRRRQRHDRLALERSARIRLRALDELAEIALDLLRIGRIRLGVAVGSGSPAAPARSATRQRSRSAPLRRRHAVAYPASRRPRPGRQAEQCRPRGARDEQERRHAQRFRLP